MGNTETTETTNQTEEVKKIGEQEIMEMIRKYPYQDLNQGPSEHPYLCSAEILFVRRLSEKN